MSDYEERQKTLFAAAADEALINTLVRELCTHTMRDATLIITALRRNPHYYQWGCARLLYKISCGRFLYADASLGWIDRTGRLLGNSFTQHEELLCILDYDIETVELAGWVRVCESSVSVVRRLNPAQMRTLAQMRPGAFERWENEAINPVRKELETWW